LHGELAAIGLPVVGEDIEARPRFGSETTARVREFQRLHSLSETGKVDPATGGIMSLSALVTTEGDRSKLRKKLKNAVDSVPNSLEYNYWLARYAILAGDYSTAYTTAARGFHHLDDLMVDVNTILLPGEQPLQPEVPHPENFYTYREDLVDHSQVAQLNSQLGSFDKAQYEAYLSTGSPAPPGSIEQADFDAMMNKARPAIAALVAWQTGNHYAAKRELTLAMQSYRQCQSLIADYFQSGVTTLSGDTGAQRLQAFVAQRRQQETTYASFWGVLRWRRILLSLQELKGNDRQKTIGNDGAFASAGAFLQLFMAGARDPNSVAATNLAERLDPLMLVIGTVWSVLAIGELNCQLRQFDPAIQGFTDLVNSQISVDVRFRYLCEFIEIPFIRLLTLEALLQKADAQYKTGAIGTFPDSATYHGLFAAQTYHEILARIAEDTEDYTVNLTKGRDAVATAIQQSLQQKDTTSLAFRTLCKNITVPTISGTTSAVPGLDSTLGPHESIAKITPPPGQVTRATNPRLYAIGLFAVAKLEQIKAGFNYLGYPSHYVPPWRFSFLLDRARYFAEHAKNVERDYLNFLSNAEHEEFQEQSAAQNIEMEKSNIRIETARVDQALAEVSASHESEKLADLNASDAKARLDNYRDFDSWMSVFEDVSLVSSFAEAIFSSNPFKISEAAIEVDKAWAQRELEKKNLKLAVGEANQAAKVAQAQLGVATAGLVVAGLLRQAAILRHEFAVENLNYLRNRTLNADQWFRLANAIRSVADTYLRYAIETAFLAEQAYEFETDKRLDVIRFDYDLSEVGAMLAADFLLRDLDTLEQDLVVSQRSRQQQMRYVLSLAREFPEALQELRDNGRMTFSLRLEQLERRFPGLFNLRIATVEVLPLALLDATRFSLELTHLGSGQVRLMAQPTDTPEPNSGEWLQGLQSTWSVKNRIIGPETAVFSGLTRQDLAGLPSFVVFNQRGAFEGLPGASAWQIDLSMKENRIVPNSLADLLITFTLSGYHDATLRDAVDHAPRKPLAVTTWFSAHQSFPDAYYRFNRTGRMDWTIEADILALQGTVDHVQNVAVLCVPSQKRAELGRMICSYPIEFEVDQAGGIRTLRELPRISFSANGLVLDATLNIPGATATFDFGDGSGVADGSTLPHTYARPGRYDVVVRIAAGGRLTEYRAAVVVSQQHAVSSPCIVFHQLPASLSSGKLILPSTLQSSSGETLPVSWRIDGRQPDPGSSPISFTLGKGRYVLRLTAIRPLVARFFSQQRHDPTTEVAFDGLHLATNRTFDVTGAETTSTLNEFGMQVFKQFPAPETLSPIDRWTLDLALDENPCLVSVSAADARQHDLGELSDVFLSLEYVVVET
jgi:hypothetical protein